MKAMCVQITVELNSDPVTAELKFPVGLPVGSTLNLILQRTPNLQPHTRCEKDFVLRHAYVNGKPVPVARRQCGSKCNISRAIKINSPMVNEKALCVLNTKCPVNDPIPLLSIFGNVPRSGGEKTRSRKHELLADDDVTPVDPTVHHSYSCRPRAPLPVIQLLESSAECVDPPSPRIIDVKSIAFSLGALITCKMCHSDFESSEKLLQHDCPYVPVWSFKCTQCIENFNEEHLLKSHMENAHSIQYNDRAWSSQEFAYICGICRSQTLGKEEAVLHSKGHLTDDIINDEQIKIFVILRQESKSCSTCGEKFRDPKLLETHQSTVHELEEVVMEIVKQKQGTHRCDVCKKEFSSNQRLQSHQWTHKTEKPYKCNVCDCSFVHNKQLTAHSYVHTGDWPFKCAECPQGFLKKDQLTVHQRRMHDIPCYACHVCSMRYLSEANLEQHLSKKHAESALFRCAVCEKPFFNERFFKKHEEKCIDECNRTTSKQDIRSFLCSYCDAVFSTYKGLCDHVAIHPEATVFKCETCGKVSLHSGIHQQHLLSHTKKKNKTQLKPIYQCVYCDRNFKSRKGIQSHMNFHANIHPYGCTLCGASLSSRKNLETHMVSIHGHPGDDAKCPHCPKVFKLKRSLNIHINTMHGQKFEHKCDMCSKKLATERKLQKHKALVHMNDAEGLKDGEENLFPLLKLLACGQCPFRTFSYARMVRHRVNHTGIYPHQCVECDKHFIFKDQLNHHVRIVHRRRRLSCPHCPRLFLAEHLYQQHVEVHRTNQGHACTVCSHYYESEAALEHHNQCHIQNLPIECNICKQRFKFSQGLVVHRRFRHRGTDKNHIVGDHTWTYSCNVCQTRFKYQSGLAAHRLNKHTTHRKLECNFCGKVFNSQCILSLHIRTHTGEKPHVCQHCGKAFRIQTNLKNHVITQHTKEFKMFCPLCNKGMVSNMKLKQHLVQSHKAISGRKGGKKESAVEDSVCNPGSLMQVAAEDSGALLTQMIM